MTSKCLKYIINHKPDERVNETFLKYSMDPCLGVHGYTARLNGVHTGGAGLVGKKGQDAAAGTDIQHNLAGKIGRIVKDGALVRGRADKVLVKIEDY